MNLNNFVVPLTQEAYKKAHNFSQKQIEANKAKQVYYNTLAVYAVNFYCQCLDVKTDIENSDSQNIIWQTLSNVADLKIINIGQLECRYFLPEATHLYIPPEVWFNRIGYVSVRIEEDNFQAILTGFITHADKELISLNQLDNLENIIDYLQPSYSHSIEENINRLTAATSASLINLNSWLQGVFTEEWKRTSEIFGTSNQTLNLAFTKGYLHSEAIIRGTIIDLGMVNINSQISLIIQIDSDSEDSMEILVHLVSLSPNEYLPEGLTLSKIEADSDDRQVVEVKPHDRVIQINFNQIKESQFTLKLDYQTDTFWSQEFVS